MKHLRLLVLLTAFYFMLPQKSEVAAASKVKSTVRITKVTVPAEVKQGTKGFNLSVRLAGNPIFPVTLAYYPKACPKGCIINGGSFAPLFATFSRSSTVLTVKDIQACNLVVTNSIFFDYAVSVKDAFGKVAKPVDQGFTCVP